MGYDRLTSCLSVMGQELQSVRAINNVQALWTDIHLVVIPGSQIDHNMLIPIPISAI